MAALPVQVELGGTWEEAPQLPQGDVPGGAFRAGDQFQKETPGFIHFFVQKSPEAGRNILFSCL